MPGGFLCEIYSYDEVWLELGLHIPKIRENVILWYIIDPKVLQSTSNALICMPEGLLCEMNQY